MCLPKQNAILHFLYAFVNTGITVRAKLENWKCKFQIEVISFYNRLILNRYLNFDKMRIAILTPIPLHSLAVIIYVSPRTKSVITS